MLSRVRIDRLRRDDAAPMTIALRDWQVVRWLSRVPSPYGLDDALDFIRAARPDEMAIRIDDRFVGMVRASRDFGIWLAPVHQRRGIAQRAAVLALSRVFAQGAAQVVARHIEGNHRSAALLGRLGFRDTGPLLIPSRAEGRDLPGRRLVLSRATFGARHGIRLETPRLTLDGLRAADLAELRRIATLPQVARMLFLFHDGMSDDDFAAIFPDEALVPPFRLVARRDGRVCGSIGVGAGTSPPIWYFLDPTVSGAGLGSEMLAAFLSEVRLRYAPAVIEAQVFADNPASLRMLEKAGFITAGFEMLTSRGRATPAPGMLLRWTAG